MYQALDSGTRSRPDQKERRSLHQHIAEIKGEKYIPSYMKITRGDGDGASIRPSGRTHCTHHDRKQSSTRRVSCPKTMQLHVVKGAWNETLGALELVRSASVSDPRSASSHGEESLASSHAIGHSAARGPGQFSSPCRLTSSRQNSWKQWP